ncbi:MAG: 5-(carboxyamino)imidazole ribonucleotide synthase, partial [Asticcacaulis sp.]
ALQTLAGLCRRVTFEFENVPAAALERLQALGVSVAPGPQALAVTQDRVAEKTFARSVGVGTVDFVTIETAGDIPAALAQLGAPALLKTRREGYDGKGQIWIKTADEAEAAFAAIGSKPAILEARAPFVMEVSVIAARSTTGEMAFYPLGENTHENGILRTTRVPARLDANLTQSAHSIARALLKGLDYVGVMGVELFVLENGTLLLNEIAPRVHNTGHWTQDGGVVDQFEQHIRAIAGWPLGSTTTDLSVEMTNLLGHEAEQWAALAAEPDARLHLYGKGEGRPGRKMGHINRILRG